MGAGGGGGGGGSMIDLEKSIDYLLIFVSEWTNVKDVFCRDKHVRLSRQNETCSSSRQS